MFCYSLFNPCDGDRPFIILNFRNVSSAEEIRENDFFLPMFKELFSTFPIREAFMPTSHYNIGDTIIGEHKTVGVICLDKERKDCLNFSYQVIDTFNECLRLNYNNLEKHTGTHKCVTSKWKVTITTKKVIVTDAVLFIETEDNNG